jgi:uncharacterized protein YndB with AHSA1/START domain
MSTTTTGATQFDVRRRQLAAGEARAAVFRRVYDADIEDVWDACTNPERLRRWYAPVEGDLRLGGAFTQGDFGNGVIVACESPRLLRVALGGNDPASDEIELRLESAADGTTVLEFEHATMRGDQEVGGQIYDAVYCMGGGYPPRLVTLDQHLRGVLRPDVDVRALHLDPEYGEAIQHGMASLVPLIEKDKHAHAS